MTLSADDLQKLRTKQVANVIRKLNAGKTLTAREEAMLAQERGGGAGDEAAVQTSGKLPATGGYAKTWDELAKAIGVTRRGIQKWRERPDLRDKLPVPKADGRHDIAAWLQCMIDLGLAGADGDLDDDDSGSVRDWKKRREQLQCFKLERSIAREDGGLLIAGELEVAVGQMLAGLQTALSQMPGAAARFLVGLRDVHDVQDRLQTEVDTVLSQLSLALYLDDCLEETLRSLPDDAEAAGKLKSVLFDEKDLPAFLDLLSWMTRNVFGRVGRRALQTLTQIESSEARETEIPISAGTAQPSEPSGHAARKEPAKRAPSTSSRKSHKSKAEQQARAKRKLEKLSGKVATPPPESSVLGLDPATPQFAAKSTSRRRR